MWRRLIPRAAHRVHHLVRFCVVVLAVAAGSLAANATERRALVIGIDQYEHITGLERASADATAMAEALEGWGFDVTLQTDISEQDFIGAITRFSLTIQPGDDVAFFFAGHGLSLENENYLLPADIPEVRDINEAVILRESIPVELVLDSFLERGAGSAILILDACRDNPYGGLVGGDRGLVAMQTSERSFIFTSASAGETALDRLSDDDPNPNSVFTRVLLEELRNGDRRIEELSQSVVDRVRALAAQVGHEQTPTYVPRLASAFRFAQSTPDAGGDETPRDPETVPQAAICRGVATQLPLHAMDSDFVDLTGQGAHISFGGAASVCVGSDTISITSGQQREIACEDVLNSANGGVGHTFLSAGVNWRFWFHIPAEGTPRTLQMGFYEGLTGDTPLYWIETGAELCNG